MKDCCQKNQQDFKAPDTGSEKRIARNTIYLYIRTFVMMIVSLYTSRVTLQVLGEEDFGIYNLVAGFVVLFGFLNYAMERATLRFLLVEKGGGTPESMNRVFNVAISSHIMIAGIVLVLAETIGLWFVNDSLNIPQGKESVANIVYQLAILSTIINIIRVPYNSSIIAYEKMSFYAYLSIIEALLRLSGVLLLEYFFVSHLLAIYSAIFLIVTLLVFLSYKFYCTRNFNTCRFSFYWEKKKFLEMLSFSVWSMVGGVGNIAAQQGVSIILNIFYGVVINAAVAITYQVGQAVNNIISSYQTAFNPHLVKLYVNNEAEKLANTIITSSKISYYLALMMIMPLMLNMDYVLRLWLGDSIPPHTTSFCMLFLAFYAIDAMSAPLWMANQATGKIKTYNIVFAAFVLCNLPLCYIALKLGAHPSIAFVIRIGINLLLHVFRIFYMNHQIGLPIKEYVIKSLVLPIIVTTLSVPLPMLVAAHTDGFCQLALSSLTAMLVLAAMVYLIGLNRQERGFLKTMIVSKIGKKH